MAPSLGSTLEGAVSQSPTWSGFSITKETLRPPMKSLPTHWIRLFCKDKLHLLFCAREKSQMEQPQGRGHVALNLHEGWMVSRGQWEIGKGGPGGDRSHRRRTPPGIEPRTPGPTDPMPALLGLPRCSRRTQALTHFPGRRPPSVPV